MKYVVVNCFNRTMDKIGVADSPEEAREIMKNDLLAVLHFNGYTDNDFSNNKHKGIAWDLSMTEAWYNTDDINYDWIVVEV